MLKISKEEQEKFRSSKGGWNCKQLREWGVGWPPKKGWRNRLAAGLDPNDDWDAEAARIEMKKLYQEKSGDYSY